MSVYRCILSKFYIKPQQAHKPICRPPSCILSKFYIKPQLDEQPANDYLVVSYRNSTSNHNLRLDAGDDVVVVSYRNSTSNHNVGQSYLVSDAGCILSKFYIKPQPSFSSSSFFLVVSYRNSTSNHNSTRRYLATHSVVSYRNSTSNHNYKKILLSSC